MNDKMYLLKSKGLGADYSRARLCYIPRGTKKTKNIAAVISYNPNNELFVRIGSDIDLERTVQQKDTPYRIDGVYTIPKNLAEMIIKKNEVELFESGLEKVLSKLINGSEGE